MYCVNCGKLLPDSARFCPGCGAKADTADNGTSQYARASGSKTVRQPFTSGTAKKLLTRDRVIAYLATVLMNVVAGIPVVSLQFYSVRIASYTMADALSQFFGNGVTVFFLIAEIVFGWMFLICKFVGKTRRMSFISCVASWVLLVLFFVSVLGSGSGNGDVISFEFGMVVWVAACVLESVSLYLDPRKPGGSGKTGQARQ